MTWVGERLTRLPLRVRLMGGFSAAMFVVLLAAGIFVYWRVDYDLNRSLNTDLRKAAQTIGPRIDANGVVRNRETATATGVAWQVLDSSGNVLDHGGAATTTAMVGTSELQEVERGPEIIDVGDFLPAAPAPYRLRVSRTRADPQHFLVVAERRDHRDEALRELLVQLLVAGLGALLITALVGDRLAHAALRPVEMYRRRAAEIADGALDLRLDVPANRDDEVTRLGHTFNAMLATLERALDRERHFVNEASHELRTPITLLSGRIQLARRRKRTVQQHERVLDELQVDLDRLSGMAEQLLQLGAVDAAHSEGPTDLVDVLDRLHARDDFSFELPESPAMTRVGEMPAERIIGNLLDNARTHGSPPYLLAIDRPRPGWVRLTVRDAGPGMSSELLSSATQRFTRAEEARTRPGAGLGLALVEALVADADGELRLCFAGEHISHGRKAPVECAHGPEMTATVLLPAAAES